MGIFSIFQNFHKSAPKFPNFPAIAMAIDPNSIAVTTTTTTTAANTSTTTIRSFTNPHQQQRPPQQVHHHPQLPHYSTHPSLYTVQSIPIHPLSHTPTQSSSSPAEGIIYPVASSGRGFINRLIRPLPTSDQAVTVANPNPAGYFYRPLVGLHQTASAAGGLRPHLDSFNYNNSVHMLRPPHNFQHQHLYHPHLVSSGVPIKGVPVSGQSKVVPTSSVSDGNGYKDTSDKNKDDNVVIVRDRKVRITDGASLYALCGSWLRNSIQEECQSQNSDSIWSLPQSLPVPPASDIRPKEEVQEEVEDEEDKESVRRLSKEDILKRHVKRAKKVRARLREKRLQRIARYKSRLALLLPPLMEQQFRNDAAAGT